MTLNIYSSSGALKATIEAGDSSTHSQAIMSDNVVGLSYVLYEYMVLDVNDYVIFEGTRYWATERYFPKQKSTLEWSYDVKFYGIESLIKRFLVLNQDNPEFSLTAPAREHVDLIVKGINNGMGTSDWKVGTVVASENLVVEYAGLYCDEGLRELATQTDTEYWVEGQTINLCRCEHGEEITLSYGGGLTSLEQGTADNVKFYTRLYPIGSSRNIDASRYGYGSLQLPNGAKYIDKNVEKYGVIHHYEKEAFSHIYPRRVGTISAVRSVEVNDSEGNPYTIYYFKDSGLNFDPNSYEIGGLVKQITFEGGELQGRDFEVNYSSSTGEFEIITTWPYSDDTQLPGGLLIPKIGDSYVLWNIRMPNEYYSNAEWEYLAAVEEYNAKHAIDVAVYKAPTNYIYIEENSIDLFLGRRVRLESSRYFPDTGYRSSRITKLTRKVNRPTQVDLEISDALSTGALDKIEDSINDVKNYTKTAAGSYALPDIIRTWDNTYPTDNNLFSARRSQKEFLSKLKADTAQKLIRFLEGIELGSFLSGASGGKIDAEGNGEFQTAVIRELLRSTKFVNGMLGEGFQLWMDRLTGLSNLTIDKVTVRQSLVALELLIEKVRSVGGQFVVSAANGKIASVAEDGANYIICFEQDNTFVAGDLMRCATFSGTQQRGYWVEILSADTNSVTIPISEFEGVQPWEGDECVLMGNSKNPLRQNLISIAATEDGQPRIDILDGVSAKNFNDSLRVRLGSLDGIKDSSFPLDNQPSGHGLYGDNVFLKGTFVMSTGEDILTRFSVMEGLIQSSVEGLKKDFTEDKSYLDNASFGNGLAKWKTESEAILFRFGAKWLWVNNAPLSKKGDFATIRQDDGRTTVFIKNNYILQKNADLRFIPAYTDTNSDGLKLADAVYLLFFYRVKKAGTLHIEFEGLDQTGFEPFNPFCYDGELAVNEEYNTFNHAGLWNGTGDFKLSFTGEINLYMLILSTDRAEALAYRYKTLFEQSEKLVKIAAANFDVDGNVLEDSSIITTAKYNTLMSQRFNEDGTLKNMSGLVTTGDFNSYKQAITDAGYLDSQGVLAQIQAKIDDGTIMRVEAFAGMFATAVSKDGNIVKSAEIASFVTTDAVGNLISNAAIRADQISLEGIVTANEYFKINMDGSFDAFKGTIGQGANAFVIGADGISYGDTSDWSLNNTHKAIFTPQKFIIQNQDADYNSSYHRIAFGNSADPSNNNPFGSVGYIHRRDSSSSYSKAFSPALKIMSYTNWGNGIAISTTGAIRTEGGPIFEKGSMVTVDSSPITVERLSTFNGSNFIIKNLVSDNETVYLPDSYEVKYLHGYETQNGIMMYTVTIISLVGNKKININKAVEDQSSSVGMYLGLTSIGGYILEAGVMIQATLVSDGSTTYWSIVKL